MRVVHVITGLNNGGAEAVIYRLITHDSASQHVVVSLMGMGKYGPALEEKGVKVICLNMPKGRVTVSGLFKLWRAFRKNKPDLVQTWMYHADLIGGVIAWLAGVKRIFWNVRHASLVPGETGKTTVLVAMLCARLSFLVPTKIICCAEMAVQRHSALGYKKEKMLVIGNGYQLNQFKPDSEAGFVLRSELELKGQPVLGMVGRFDVLKDHKNLLEALGLLKLKGLDFKGLLVGPNMDSENAELLEWVQNNNLVGTVFLLGPRSDIATVMNSLDVHVLSSRSEAFPNVVAEAMACGTPCVTTDVGDAALIVEETGWIVPPKEPQLLAHAIEQAFAEMKEKPQDWRNRKQACRERIKENFSIEIMVEKYNAAWSCD